MIFALGRKIFPGDDVPVITEAIAEPIVPDEIELARQELQAASQALERFELLHRGALLQGDGKGGFRIPDDNVVQEGIAVRARWNRARHWFESLLEENVQQKRKEHPWSRITQ